MTDEGFIAAIQQLFGSGTFWGSFLVAITIGGLTYSRFRNAVRDDRTSKQAVEFQEKLLAALTQSQEREKAMLDEVTKVRRENADLHSKMMETRYEIHLLRTQLRNVGELLRSVKAGELKPEAITLPNPAPEQTT